MLMRRIPLTIPILLLTSCLLLGGRPVSAAPAESGPGTEGANLIQADDFHLENYRGRVVLLDFWASWCGPCKKSLPWLYRLQRLYGKDGLVVVPVNLDRDTEMARAMLATLKGGPVRVVDPEGKLAEQFKLEGMPTSILIDRQGKVVARHIGFLPAEEDAREREIRNLLASRSE